MSDVLDRPKPTFTRSAYLEDQVSQNDGKVASYYFCAIQPVDAPVSVATKVSVNSHHSVMIQSIPDVSDQLRTPLLVDYSLENGKHFLTHVGLDLHVSGDDFVGTVAEFQAFFRADYLHWKSVNDVDLTKRAKQLKELYLEIVG